LLPLPPQEEAGTIFITTTISTDIFVMLSPTVIHCVSSSFGWRNRHRRTTQKNILMMMMMRMMTAISSYNPIFALHGQTIRLWIMEYLLLMAPCPNHHGRPLLPNPLPLPSDDGAIQQSTNNQPNLNSN
jgi:hypothetical protein